MQVPRYHARVHCSMCERPLFTVTDTRFGLAPSSVVCRECTLAGLHGGNNDLVR